MPFALAAILAAALTQEEIVERMKAPPATRLDGLVQVTGFCPAKVREEFQTPIAIFVSDVCERMYRYTHDVRRRFKSPGVVVMLGEGDTENTNVVSTVQRRDEETFYTRIWLESPAAADISALRRATVKAYYLAVRGETIDDDAAEAAMRAADPGLRRADERAEMRLWMEGVKTSHDDEYFLALRRKISSLGHASPEDVLVFASRLMLFPETFSSPFCGKYRSCTFAEAVGLAARDARIRFLALAKETEVMAFGGGRGDELLSAASAYAAFLHELAMYKKPPEELLAMLYDAEAKLKAAYDKAEYDDAHQDEW